MPDAQSDNEIKPTKELLSLKREQIKSDQVYLDPNNPRFGLDRHIPDSRIDEESLQQNCRKRIEDEIKIDDLKASFLRYGFVPTDPVVVRAFAKNKYVVLEGNRRITTLKKLVEAHDKGEIHLDKDVLDSMKKFYAFVYEGNNPDIVWLVQGLRHMSGIKEWPPLQQATFIAKIENQIKNKVRGGKGRAPGLPTVAKAAGVSTTTASRLLRSYYAFNAAQGDEEYGGNIGDEKFSIFSEAVFRVEPLKTWLGWDESSRKFTKEENVKKFLSWITPQEDDGEPKIIRALDVRDVLPSIVSDQDLLDRFETGSLNIDQARVEIGIKRKGGRDIDLESIKHQLNKLLDYLDTLPVPRIKRENREEEFNDLLEKLRGSIQTQLKSLGK